MSQPTFTRITPKPLAPVSKTAHGHDHSNDDHGHAHGGCCSHGDAPAKIALDDNAGGALSRFRIEQMDCPTEQTLIQQALGKQPGVHALEFNLINRTLAVRHSLGSDEPIIKVIASLGMSAQPLESDVAPAPEPARKPWWPLALSGAAALAAELTHLLVPGVPWLPAVLAALAIAGCGLGTWRKGWIALKHRNLNINALMSIAVTGALLIGQWPEAAMVMFLFTVAELIEARSLARARNAIGQLLQLAPATATLRQPDGSWQEVAAASVTLGATLRVRPGERLALDGEVTSGHSSIDQAPITGESLPVEKNPGDRVFAGTINQAGSLEFRVTALAKDSTLSRIIHAVEQAQGARAPTQRFVDNFSRFYTPAVFGLALLIAVLPPLVMGGGWFDWLYRALVLLVVACPCALVISTPVSIVSALAAAARHGILIKGGVYLENGHRLSVLALDKTGTLTHGKPVQTDWMPLIDTLPAERLRQLAASLAARSDHPVSQALAHDASPLPVERFEALPGRGVRAEHDGVLYNLGNHRLVEELGVCSPALEAHLERFETQGKTVVVLCGPEGPMALFAVADTLRQTSREAIEQLHTLGVRTLMLTGDNRHTAQAIAREAGIDEARGDLLPEDKLAVIESLVAEGRTVGMVGDGINDAPALARADLGFAMGAAGTDSAIETADVALMDDDLRKIPSFIQLSRRTRAVLIQNIALALVVKALFLAVAVAGYATLWMAVFADMGVSLLVVFNGLRLARR
ncbi:heavy metal translocating P-type ATPase [Pseudomonas sp. KNUC1026]|uniref:heavy metal translocating P-type ATPase n=1 Tax=Pseudomonas sp. KNUC1026 TaxID=2893890 RepID=UPI001F257FDF|nr:heavy metal translocating P-type ATPase [Pseudomonas sp. KNUC1026]UFH49636.1 heavy metal translocating P-type ATPase [Pseudomonas sp. KNUC1026]